MSTSSNILKIMTAFIAGAMLVVVIFCLVFMTRITRTVGQNTERSVWAESILKDALNNQARPAQ